MEEEITCLNCYYCKNRFCTKWKTKVQDYFKPNKCKFFETGKKPLNKGLQIRNNKLLKKQKKRNTVKPEQVELCRFVEVQWEVIKRVNGKYRRTGRTYGKGLQIKNRVYLTNGHFKMVNNKSFRINKKYKNIPDWATPELINKYKKFNRVGS